MKIVDKIKTLFRRRPPTEEEIARAQANMIREDRFHQATEGGAGSKSEILPYDWH